jgi:CRP/FNR family transcriptional regulator
MSDVKKKLEDFFSQYPLHTSEKGKIIIHPEQQPSGAYFVLEGNVREYAISTEGIELTIHIFNPSSYFPMTYVVNTIPNRHYYESLNSAKLYLAPKEAVLTFLHSNQDVLFELTSRLLSGLDGLSLRIESLIFTDASKRLVSILLLLSRHFGEEQPDGVMIKELFTHRNVATLAGISRETASRTLEKLEQKGVITYKNQHIFIPSLKILQEELAHDG